MIKLVAVYIRCEKSGGPGGRAKDGSTAGLVHTPAWWNSGRALSPRQWSCFIMADGR